MPVASAEGLPRTWMVASTLCQPWRWAKEVDVLTSGSTYTRSYWDWPYKPELYSYVGKTLAAGRATLAYDRIGNGTSSPPGNSADITMATDAYVLHKLIDGVRALGFRQINSVSHSYGSGVALAEAVSYTDVSAVVLTGYLHRPSNPLVTAGNWLANLDPKFEGLGLDDGWLTTRPGARLYGFHSATSDLVLVGQDEDGKDLVSRTGLLDFLSQRNVPAAANISNLVKVPVLVVGGQLDAIFCLDPAVFNCADVAAVTANEDPFYGPNFEVKTVPESGHDLTLHPSANVSFAMIDQWLQSH
jgi:pimeloyl-ACP methyl ester carboxylesterase